MRFLMVGLCAVALAVCGCGGPDPLVSFEEHTTKIVADYEANEACESIRVVDTNVVKSDSLTYPYTAIALIEVMTPVSMRHPDLPQEDRYRMMCTATNQHRLTYRLSDGEWELVGVEDRVVTIDPSTPKANLGRDVSNAIARCESTEFQSGDLDLYGDTGAHYSQWFWMSETEFLSQWPDLAASIN